MRLNFLTEMFLFLGAGCLAQELSLPSQQKTVCCEPSSYRGMDLKFLNSTPDAIGFKVEAAYLYWNVLTDAMDYAYTYVENGSPNGALYQTDARIIRADWPWESAPRVEAGFAGEFWDTKASWTYFKTNDSASFSEEVFQPGGSVGAIARRLRLLWLVESRKNASSPNAFFQNITDGEASSGIKYTTLDWVAGRSLSLHEHFYLRPFFGVRAAWIKQSLKTEAVDFNAAATGDLFRTTTKLHNLFRGCGLYFGGNAKYHATTWFSFYANAALSLLAGSFDLRENQATTLIDFADPVVSHSDLSRAAIRPSLALGAGIDLSFNGNKGNFTAGLTGGYEVNYWPNQGEWVRFVGNYSGEYKHPGDLTFHGAVVQGYIIF